MTSGFLAGHIPADNLPLLFQYCNARYFDGAIVPSPGFRLRFSRSVRLSGCFRFCLETSTDWIIEISGRLRDHPRALRSTMVHEMIHMLAHQRFRETGDRFWLDEQPTPGKPFTNAGHGAFFLGEMERLNLQWPELGVAVKSTFGNYLYERERIAPVRLLLITLDQAKGKGMVYRLHPEAELAPARLFHTARELHGAVNVQVVQVAGELAEGFPALRKDNAPRAGMKIRSLRGFDDKVSELLAHAETRELLGTGQGLHRQALARLRPQAA